VIALSAPWGARMKSPAYLMMNRRVALKAVYILFDSGNIIRDFLGMTLNRADAII
jgi:hypothetical protein